MTKTTGLIKIGHIVERSQQLLQSVTVDSCHQLPSGTNREKMNNTGQSRRWTAVSRLGYQHKTVVSGYRTRSAYPQTQYKHVQ